MYKLLEKIRSPFCDRVFLRKAVVIALPVALQGFLNTVVNLVDTVMIGTLGESTISAVGLANKVFFVFSLLVFGCCSGVGVLASQFWGNRDTKNIKKVMGLALLIGLVSSAFFVIPSLLCPNLVMSIFTNSEGTIAVGAKYLVIAALSYPFTAVSNVLVAMLRSVGKAKIPVATSLLTILINVVLNYILIFGKFGAPALGAEGAALATLVARICEMLILIVIIYLRKMVIAAKPKELFGYSKKLLVEFFRTAAPVIANEFMWGLGVTIYSVAYGRMGDGAVAAITVAQTLQDLVLVLFQGLSAATAIVLGNEMGAGRLELAKEDAGKFLWLQFVISIFAGIFLYLMRWQFIGIYSLTPEVAQAVNLCIIVFILYLPAKSYNYINIVGVLRSGGDTTVCLILDTAGVWLIGVPFAFLGALVFHFPIHIVYAMVLFEEAVKMVGGFWRYRSGKWVNNLAIKV